jgi:intein/homing endonuclease
LYSKLENSGEELIEDLSGRKFIFPKKLEMPFFDEKSNSIKNGVVKYIEKHKTTKKVYKVKTKSGKCINVTEDHSIMILEDGKLIEKKPSNLLKTDKIITIL